MRMTVSREPRLLEQRCGETGFPRAHAPQGNGETGGRVWEGAAPGEGYGETGFPHAPTRGRAWRQVQMPVSLFEPRPRPREGLALKQG